MYTPHAFAEDDPAALAHIIAANPFGVIVSAGPDGPVGTHLPFVLDGPAGPGGRLIAHMAKGNPHARSFDGATPALVIFTGAHAYISPRWYAGPRNVPTWNYEAVHVAGRPVLVKDPAETRAHMERLVAAMETGTEAWSLDATAAEYIAGMLNGVVAFCLPIDRIEGKRKMGQNKSEEDRRAAAGTLLAAEDSMTREVGRMMLATLREDVGA